MITRKSTRSKILRAILLCGVLLLLMPIVVYAQDFPTRPINVTLGYAPGGAVDVAFRPLAAATEKILGQPLVIVNNGAANGEVALGIVAKQKPDGYSLGVIHSGLLTAVPHLKSALPYKMDDFVPIMSFGVSQNIIVVKADAPWKTMKELVQAARQNPGKLTFYAGTPGTGMVLNVEQVATAEKVQFTHVPFPGGGPALTALLGGHIDFFAGGGSAVSAVKAGTARILSVMANNRMKDFPNAPSFRDLGYKPVPTDFFFVYAPKGVAPAIIKKLEEAFTKATKDPLFIQTLGKLGIFDEYHGSEATKKDLSEDFAEMGRVIKEYNIPKQD